MADKKKSEPCVYGVKEPTNINQLNRAYMIAFLKDKIEKGEIKKEQVEKYVKERKAKCKTAQKERRLFAEMFIPGILPQSEKPSFDAELEALISE